MHELRDTLPQVVFRDLNPHRAKNLFETGFGGQLVPMPDDLATELLVAGVGFVELSGADWPAVPFRPPAKKRRGQAADLQLEPLRTGSEGVVEVERNCLVVHYAAASPTGSTIPGTPRGDSHDIAALILNEGRPEVARRRLNFPMVRAPGKNWRVQPVWACLCIDTPP
jgi:hypothetical protein